MTDFKYCVKCGSKLGIDCGEAEPDYNERYCSKGCFETSLIDFTQDSEYKRLYESKSDQKIMETKGGDTCSTEESRQSSERNRC